MPSFLYALVSLHVMVSAILPLFPFLDVPARLKKELDTVLLLQADLETSDKALQAA